MAEDRHLAPGSLHDLATHDGLQAVVPALDQDIRQNRRNERLDTCFRENCYVIDIRQSTEDCRPVLYRDQRSAWTLHLTDTLIAIEADNEDVAEGACLLQIFHVTAMQHVKAAIGEYHSLPVALAVGATGKQI